MGRGTHKKKKVAREALDEPVDRGDDDDASDRFVTIKTVSDAVQAGMIVELLADEGIPAQTPGLGHGAIMGNLLTAALNVPLRVPQADAKRAIALIAALETYEPAEEDDESDDEPAESDERIEIPASHGRNPRAVVAVALVLPFVLGAFGAGHFYVRSYATGFLLLVAGWLSIVVGLSGFDFAFFGVPCVIVFDALFAGRSRATR